MEKFTITDEMRKFVKENKKYFSSRYLDDMRYIGIEFCNKFNTEGNFDTRGNSDGGDMFLLYVATIKGLTIILDGDIRFNNGDEFLDFIDNMENYIIRLKNSLSLNQY